MQMTRATLVSALLISVLTLALRPLRHNAALPVEPVSVGPVSQIRADLSAPADSALLVRGAARPIYALSLVPGGVFTLETLRRDVALDPLLARAYSGFDFSHARVGTFALDEWRFVSFRRAGAIYWTTRPILIRSGETYLTDGAIVILARCGNVVQPLAQFPQEEPPGSLDTVSYDVPWPFAQPALTDALMNSVPDPFERPDAAPQAPQATHQDGAGLSADLSAEFYSSGFNSFNPGAIGGVNGFNPVGATSAPHAPIDFGGPDNPPGNTGLPGSPPVVPTPEPHTLALIGAGLVAAWFVGRRSLASLRSGGK
jgi:hypothetical protein